MARKEPFVNIMPHISKEYVPEEYDEYEIAPLQDADLLKICTQMIRAKEFDQATLEVMSWGILKSIEEEKFLSQEIEVTAPDGTMLQGILEEQNCSGTMVLMIKPYSDIGLSKYELVRDPRELLIAGYNDYNRLLLLEDMIRTLYPQYTSRLKECNSRWEKRSRVGRSAALSKMSMESCLKIWSSLRILLSRDCSALKYLGNE